MPPPFFFLMKPYGIIDVAAYEFHTLIANHSKVYLSATNLITRFVRGLWCPCHKMIVAQ